MTGTWEQVKDGNGRETGNETAVIGLHKDILVNDHQGRESQASGGDRWMGEQSIWMVAPLPSKWGREAVAKGE